MLGMGVVLHLGLPGIVASCTASPIAWLLLDGLSWPVLGQTKLSQQLSIQRLVIGCDVWVKVAACMVGRHAMC
jgi:hypothetical protein